MNLIGLAQKAGRLAVGEEPTGAAARARDARLILVAADAAENSVRRVRHFADAGQCLWCRIGADKDALGRAVGRSSCAMLAVMDIGFARPSPKSLPRVRITRLLMIRTVLLQVCLPQKLFLKQKQAVLKKILRLQSVTLQEVIRIFFKHI